jgi:hypothetical protein
MLRKVITINVFDSFSLGDPDDFMIKHLRDGTSL